MQAGYVPMKYFFVTVFSVRILFNSKVDKGSMFATGEIKRGLKVDGGGMIHC